MGRFRMTPAFVDHLRARGLLQFTDTAGDVRAYIDLGSAAAQMWTLSDIGAAAVTAPIPVPSLGKVCIGRDDGRVQQIDLGTGLSEAERLVGAGTVYGPALDIEGPTGTGINRLMAAGEASTGGSQLRRFCILWLPGPAAMTATWPVGVSRIVAPPGPMTLLLFAETRRVVYLPSGCLRIHQGGLLMSEAGKVQDWQRRLLPLMVIVLLVLAAFACITNLYQVRAVQAQALKVENLDFSPVWQSLDKPLASSLAYAHWKTAVMLESAAMHRRFHQASAITLTRIYIVFLGFMSGMVMALIGSTFILGKLDAPASRLEAEATGWKFVLLTSSPGILLVVLGTTLMVVTILARAEVQVTEAALYLPRFEVVQGGAAPGPEAGWEEKQGILRKVKAENEKKQEP